MFAAKVIIFVLCLNRIVSHNILIASATHDSCLKQILSEALKYVESLTITWSHHIDNALKDKISNLLIDKIKFIVTNRQSQATNNGHNPGTVLILASTTADITDGIVSLHNNNAWSVMSDFIVLYSNKNGNGRKSSTEPHLKNIFEKFASLNALKVKIIYEFNDAISEFTWFPYEDSNCDTVDRVRLISECEFGFYQNHSYILDANKLESTYTITAGVQSREPYAFYSKDSGFSKGVEIDLVKELAHWLHFNIELEPINRSYVIGGATLKEKNFDIIIGASHELTQSIDFYFDDLTWCVKKADLIPPWRSFFLVATWQVWTITAIGCYVVASTLFVFYRYYHHPENYHYCVGIAILCLIAVPVPYNPSHGIARIHFGILLLYGLNAVILINCYLTSVLINPHYQYQIHTIEDLIHYEYKILADEELVSLNYLGTDRISSYTKANFEHCYGVIDCLNQLFERSRVALILPRKLSRHFESKTSFSFFCFDESETFNKVKRSLTFSRTNSYLLKKTNFFIRRAMETGHLLKWEANSVGSKKYDSQWNWPVVLTVEHISAILLIYAAVMIVASLCFIGERLAFKNIAKNNHVAWKWFDKYILSTERLVFKKSVKSTIRSKSKRHGKNKVEV